VLLRNLIGAKIASLQILLVALFGLNEQGDEIIWSRIATYAVNQYYDK
jgi:hypothetical protein